MIEMKIDSKLGSTSRGVTVDVDGVDTDLRIGDIVSILNNKVLIMKYEIVDFGPSIASTMTVNLMSLMNNDILEGGKGIKIGHKGVLEVT